MLTPIRKTGLFILAIIIVPVIIFSVYEIGRVRQNEKVIQDIYINQLDAILFSINQYSDDVLSNLANRIENGQHNDTGIINRIISESPAIKALVQFTGNYRLIRLTPASAYDEADKELFLSELQRSDSVLNRLQTYYEAGYRKIEAIQNPSGNEQWIVFISKHDTNQILNLLVIDPEIFINQVLDPKIQQISHDKFYIAAYRSGQKVPFYSSAKQTVKGEITEKRPFWLFSRYEMGIELMEITIAELAVDRTKKNLLVVILMDIILIAGAFLIYRNVRKQLELSQLKSDFVSSVSHEIRTPLALISMYVETLEMERIKDPVKIKDYYNVILNETSRLSAMVNRILSFSQIEDKKRKYTPELCSLNDIAEKAASGFKYSFDSHGFKFRFEPVENLPDISADREAVTDAIVNLIDNAMKYSREKKDIALRTGMDNGFSWVEVEDKGIGISPKNQKYIFEKFYRVTEKNLANRVKGSGLGLAIVKHIMDAHHGKVSVRSIPDEGSAFKLLFPANKTN